VTRLGAGVLPQEGPGEAPVFLSDLLNRP
jgi:hypothetical protein